MGKVDNHADGHNRPNDDAQIPVKGDKIPRLICLFMMRFPINKGNQKDRDDIRLIRDRIFPEA